MITRDLRGLMGKDKQSVGPGRTGSANANCSDGASVTARCWNWIRWTIALVLMSYVTYRIVTLDITNDEWGSLKDVYHKGIPDLVTFKYASAQSHFLQSLVSIVCLQSLPAAYEVAAVRIPSLLGLMIYLYAAFRITSVVKENLLSVLGFAALCANAYLLDFFGLARGYGLANGFLLISLWHVLNVFRESVPSSRVQLHANLAAWSGGMAVLANLAWMNYYGALSLMLLWHSFSVQQSVGTMRRVGRTLIASQGLIYTGLIVGVFYLPRVMLMSAQDGLYFGGQEGFITDTVQSLVKAALYVPGEVQNPGYLWVAYGIVLLCGATAVIAVIRPMRNAAASEEIKASAVVAAALLLSVALTLIMHLFLNVRFVIERAALGFLVIGVCHILLFAASVDNKRRTALVVILVLYIIGGVANLNLTRTCSWRMNSQIREFVQWVGEERAKTGRHLIIGTDTSANYTMWYYVEKLLGLKESEQTRAGIGFVRIYNGVTIYSLELPEEKALFDSNTDFVLLRHREPIGKYPQPLRLLRRYRSADCDLFACEGGRGDQLKDFKPFNGAVYPARFYR